MKALILSTIGLFALSGCTVFGDKGLSIFQDISTRAEEVGNRAYEEAATSLDWWCVNMDAETRANVRAKIAEHSADGNVLEATCASDQ